VLGGGGVGAAEPDGAVLGVGADAVLVAEVGEVDGLGGEADAEAELAAGGLGVADEAGDPLAEGAGDDGVGGQDAVEFVEGDVDERPGVADLEGSPPVLGADLLPVLAEVVGGGEVAAVAAMPLPKW
jgi:hypothetical protein